MAICASAAGSEDRRHPDVQRVIRRESGADLEIGHDPRIEPLGELDAEPTRRPRCARPAPPRSRPGARCQAWHGSDQSFPAWLRPQRVGSTGAHRGVGAAPTCALPAARHPAQHMSALEGRCLRSRRRGPPLRARPRHSRLVIPFGVTAHDRGLVARGVDPVDPWPALWRHQPDRWRRSPAPACGRTRH